jgi:F0F1-type ATP synthase assembly protein I
MSAPTEFEVMIFATTLVVLTLAYGLVKFAWSQPLKNGPGFFLGVEVPAGFYDGRGKLWLNGYRAALLALHLALVVALGGCFVLKRWEWMPVWCGGFALVYVPTYAALTLWMRHKLGTRPPVRAVAFSLQSRHLGDYISWPLEALSAAIVASCWWVLLRHGAKFDWLPPFQMTWSAIVLPGKIALVHSGAPLPAERTEEHYRYQDATRRNSINVLNSWGWLMVVTLCIFPLRQFVSPMKSLSLIWIFLAVFTAVFVYMMFLIFRGQKLATTMGRDLYPSGNFATPYRSSSWMGTMSRPYLVWFAIWFGGILALILYSQFR